MSVALVRQEHLAVVPRPNSRTLSHDSFDSAGSWTGVGFWLHVLHVGTFTKPVDVAGSEHSNVTSPRELYTVSSHGLPEEFWSHPVTSLSRMSPQASPSRFTYGPLPELMFQGGHAPALSVPAGNRPKREQVPT